MRDVVDQPTLRDHFVTSTQRYDDGKQMRRFAWLFAVLAMSAGCHGSNPALATPSATPAAAPQQPPPTAVSLSVTGVVADAATSAPIAGATVRMLDGVNGQRSATTNARGEYRFENLETGSANLSAVAPSYVELRSDVFIDGAKTLNFALTRAARPPQ